MAETSPPTSMDTCSNNDDASKYTHDESATIHLNPTIEGNDDLPSLYARVHLESTSTLTSSTPLLQHHDSDNTGTPFSQDILHLLSKFKLHRLMIQIGDRASSNGSINEQTNQFVMGPSGTSITASFLTYNNSYDDNDDAYKIKYASLLRYLLDKTFFPACGAPLDSVRERKHGHSIVVRTNNTNKHDNSTQTAIVEVTSNLPADGSTFCSPEFILKNGVWGKATNGPCRYENDNWGVFDSLFAQPIFEEKDRSAATFETIFKSSLSGLLLGSSLDSFHGSSYNNHDDARHSIWAAVQASPTCFTSYGRCRVEVNRGVSYRIGLPSFITNANGKEGTSSSNNENNDVTSSTVMTLGDLLLGRQQLQQLVRSEGWKAWYPCPLSDSSKVTILLPTGYEAIVIGEGRVVVSGRIEVDTMTWNDGYLDLAEPWIELYRNNSHHAQKSTPTQEAHQFGISRTVQRPHGITGSGTWITVVRVNNQHHEHSLPMFRVETVDVLPGQLIQPKMHTLRMMLYQGGGAGDVNFVPMEGYDYDNVSLCSSDKQCELYNRTTVALSDLQDYNLIKQSDGTVMFERTMDLEPDSSVWMIVDYDERYLPFQKFPADANRGVDVFPSRASFTPINIGLPSQQQQYQQPTIMLYSPSLLIMPPVPDMSMPFNVISLSCTLWAFVLGSMINILVRRGTESVKRDLTGEKEKRPIDRLKEKLCEKGAKLKALFKRISRRSTSTEAEEIEELNGSTDSQGVEEEMKDN